MLDFRVERHAETRTVMLEGRCADCSRPVVIVCTESEFTRWLENPRRARFTQRDAKYILEAGRHKTCL